MTRRVLVLSLPFVLLVCLLVPGSHLVAGQEPSTDPEEQQNGALLYRVHCLSCHGDEGRGDGPNARNQGAAPADLTALAASNEGHFPKERIERVIDGRRPCDPDPRSMPVWGLAFQQQGLDADQRDEVQRRVRDLVAYLQSIQAE